MDATTGLTHFNQSDCHIFLEAAQKGDLSTLGILIKQNSDKIPGWLKARNKSGQTALHLAVYNQDEALTSAFAGSRS